MFIDEVRKELRISNTAFDGEITSLILEAKTNLKIRGLSEDKIVESDSLIGRAIKLYAKAYFGLNNPDSERYVKAYEALAIHLSLSGDYKAVSDV